MPDINYTVGDIEARCSNDNIAGLVPTAHVTTELEVETIPTATNLVVAGPITMSTSSGQTPAVPGTFKEWKLAKTQGKNTYNVTDEGDEDSAQMKVEVAFILPKATAERVWAARGGCSHIIVIKDKNGAQRIIGEKGNGCVPKYQEEISGATNEMKVTFTWYPSHPPYFYTGEIPG